MLFDPESGQDFFTNNCSLINFSMCERRQRLLLLRMTNVLCEDTHVCYGNISFAYVVLTFYINNSQSVILQHFKKRYCNISKKILQHFKKRYCNISKKDIATFQKKILQHFICAHTYMVITFQICNT
jgi:hypothetical protein